MTTTTARKKKKTRTKKKEVLGTIYDVTATWLKHVVQYAVSDAEATKISINNFIFKQRKEGVTDDIIYEKIGHNYPEFGNPYDWFHELYLDENETASVCMQAAIKARKAAAAAVVAAENEFHNKRRCKEKEMEERSRQATYSNLTTPAATGVGSIPNITPMVGVGMAVEISQDLSPGKCSHGGTGHVIGILNTGMCATFTVKYDGPSGGRTETGVGYKRITPLPLYYRRHTSRPVRTAAVPVPILATTGTKLNNNKTIIEMLQYGKTHGRGKGWRAKDLNVFTTNRYNSEEFDCLFMADYILLNGYLMGNNNGKKNRNNSARSTKTQQFTRQKVSSLAITKNNLYYAWGVTNKYPSRMELKKERKMIRETTNIRKSVIDCIKVAKQFCTAKHIFMQQYISRKVALDAMHAYDNTTKENMKTAYRTSGNNTWKRMSTEQKEVFEVKRREMLARQPYMKDLIIDTLRNNPSMSYDNLAKEINYCCAATIQNWMASHAGYKMYTERTLPLLSSIQMKRHVTFAQRLQNNWYLPRQKILWIHYDEKWWYGHVNRGNCKLLEILGLEKQYTFVQHKCHIDKVMVVAFVAYAFDQNIDNGGDGIKLGFFRCEGARVAKMTVRKSRRTETGALVRDGAIIRRSGDVYLVDCNVTGSDEGTSSAPKFSLLSVFCDHIFPKVEDLVGPGGQYEGYLPVIQGDNAGPHCDARFMKFVTDYCNNNNMKWEPQAPQMPHANNLDLAVFPAMSKQHSNLLKSTLNSVATCDQIWNAAERVWRDLSSAKIARGFVLANRITKKVILGRGSNTFLREKDFHSKVREDFQETTTGVRRKINVV